MYIVMLDREKIELVEKLRNTPAMIEKTSLQFWASIKLNG